MMLANKSSQKTYDKEVRSRGTYILERTRAFFTGQPDKPYSRAACFKPVDSGAAPLRTAASATATRSPTWSGPAPWPLRWQELNRGPRRQQGTREHPRPRRPG
jgi:hypothetical protein